MTNQQEEIRAALNQLQTACGLDRSDHSTECLFHIMCEAVDLVDWTIVEDSHADGLCFDVNCLLAEAVDSVAERYAAELSQQRDGHIPVAH